MFTVKAVLFLLNLYIHLICGIPHLSKRAPESQGASIANQIQRDLGSRLSPGAMIYLAHDSPYQYANIRWSAAQHPDFAAVIVPAIDGDVAAAVSPSFQQAQQKHQTLTRSNAGPTRE